MSSDANGRRPGRPQAPAFGPKIVQRGRPARTALVAPVDATEFGRASHAVCEAMAAGWDSSQAMVDAARRHAARLGLANVECQVLDAERLDLADDVVDGVLCRWGYMLMADPAAAFRETRRVLRPGGRLSCAVFGDAAHNPWAAVPARVLQAGGHLPPPGAGAPGILALADRDRLRGLFTAGGFSDPEIEAVPCAFRFADAEDYWAFLTRAAGAIAMVLGRLDDEERQRAPAQIAELVAAYEGDDGMELPAVALVAVGS